MSNSYDNSNTRADTLNQTAAHDTGIYDPNVHDNQIVAMYETEAQARAARDILVSNGIPERAIHLTDGQHDGNADYERHDTGLWGSIKSLFMPAEEAHGYAEGVRRGHAVLIVQPDASMDRHRIVELLESSDPVDFDAKLEEWRQAGYSDALPTGVGAIAAGATGAAMGTATTPDVAADTPALHASDTTAARTDRDAPLFSARETGYQNTERSSSQPGSAYGTRGQPGRGALEETAATPPATATTVTDDLQPTRAATQAAATGQDETIKIIEERLQVGKREVVKGAVRIRSYVVERPVEQQLQLHEERVEVERHSVDRPVSAADDSLFRERVIEARATGEEAVIGKEARIVEEVGLKKESIDRIETVHDTVRKTEVEIEGDPSGLGNARDAARPSGTPTPKAEISPSSTSEPRK